MPVVRAEEVATEFFVMKMAVVAAEVPDDPFLRPGRAMHVCQWYSDDMKAGISQSIGGRRRFWDHALAETSFTTLPELVDRRSRPAVTCRRDFELVDEALTWLTLSEALATYAARADGTKRGRRETRGQ